MAAGLAFAGGVGVEALTERSAFEITEFPVGPPTGGASVMRIAWMSDMHRSHATPRWVLEQAVEACQKAEPHVILLGGDYVSSTWDLPLVPECAEILGRLRAPHGVFYVLGNHDYVAGAGTIRSAFQRAGLQELTNTSTLLSPGLHLVGVDDVWLGKPDVPRALAGTTAGTRIVFSHNPRIFPRLRENDCTLICGHTHGGQINIPLVPNPCLRSWKTYVRGWFAEGNSRMYVNRGVGTLTLPIRVNCRPEITIFRVLTG
jgi:hypothetical protein